MVLQFEKVVDVLDLPTEFGAEMSSELEIETESLITSLKKNSRI